MILATVDVSNGGIRYNIVFLWKLRIHCERKLDLSPALKPQSVGFTSTRLQTKECFCHAAPPSRRESCPWRRAAASVRPAADRYRSRSRPTRPPRRPFAYLDASGSCVHNPPPTTPDRYTPADYRLQSKLHWYVHAICARSTPELRLGPPPIQIALIPE
ncbi:unnamed protein product [Leptosia nina]|uniref:Uncharacterized protein n=1 Tax=Leptosia nina TaxID=320188 RepID=A0AAV1JM84_9NEOP